MKGTQSTDTASLQYQFAPWSDTHAALFHGSKNMEIDDVEPFRRPPAPSAFHIPAILSSFQPDPLLLVTPEKSLGLARLAGNKSAAGQLPVSGDGDGVHKGRPRVRFAPGTRTSPPSKGTCSDSVNVGTGVCEEDCEPRSFSAVSQKLYQPGLYADSEREADAKGPSPSTRALLLGTAPGKRFNVDGRGNSTMPVDQSANKITSDYSQVQQSKAVTAKVIRHKPVTLCSSHDTDTWESDTEIKEVFRHPSPVRSSSRSPACSASSSPVRSRVSSRQSSPSPSPSRPRSSPAPSPSRPRRSPSGSPCRLTPVGGPQYLTCHEDEKPQTAVKIIREAPHRPKLHSYVFPFNDSDEARLKYDSNLENPLARPEFNSALKISEELKSVKARRPEAWGTVSETLKNSEGKRTQIQEKVCLCCCDFFLIMYFGNMVKVGRVLLVVSFTVTVLVSIANSAMCFGIRH